MRELATDRAGLEILHLGDCYGLLASVPVGRIGFLAGGEVVMLPVNFLLDGQDVVFTTSAGEAVGGGDRSLRGVRSRLLRPRRPDGLVGHGQRVRGDRGGHGRDGPAGRPRAEDLGRGGRPGLGADQADVGQRAATPPLTARSRPRCQLALDPLTVAPDALTIRGWPGRPRPSAVCASGRSVLPRPGRPPQAGR